jgi:hypothetical protein
MGGGTRGERKPYAPMRDSEASTAYDRDRGKSLSDFGTKPRVFISFHIDDEAQVDLLRYQAKNSDVLEFIDYSVKEPFDEKWKTQCTEKIRQSRVVVVAIGEKTHQREAILWEINKAHELGKPVIGMRIFSDKNHKTPEPMIRNGDKVIDWNLSRLQGELDRL